MNIAVHFLNEALWSWSRGSRKCWRTLLLVSAFSLVACGHNEEVVPVDASAYKADLESLARARVFFGHQSVGRNIVQGLTELAQKTQTPLHMVSLDNATGDDKPGVFHLDIGKNGEPLGKIEAFGRLVQPSPLPAYDVAVLKFCYEDVKLGVTQDPRTLVNEYAKSVAAIRAAQPRLRLIHVTVPLRADPVEWKTPIKRLIGRPTYEDADNQLRNTFNAELRKRFAGEAIFDIAELESTLPSGQRSFFMNGAEPVYTLAREYTKDGGHLNEVGRQRVAGVFAHLVAGELGKKAN